MIRIGISLNRLNITDNIMLSQFKDGILNFMIGIQKYT